MYSLLIWGEFQSHTIGPCAYEPSTQCDVSLEIQTFVSYFIGLFQLIAWPTDPVDDKITKTAPWIQLNTKFLPWTS